MQEEVCNEKILRLQRLKIKSDCGGLIDEFQEPQSVVYEILPEVSTQVHVLHRRIQIKCEDCKQQGWACLSI